MPGLEYLLDQRMAAWTENPRPDRKGYFTLDLSDGKDGRPVAFIARQPEGSVTQPHFHTESQFQVVLEGCMSFPREKHLPVSVHYTDARVPYGPFVPEGLRLAVVRRRAASTFYMSDPQARKLRNAHGREHFGFSETAPWEPFPGLPSVKRKRLFGAELTAPPVEIRSYPPGHPIEREPAPFGRFMILLEGSLGHEGVRVASYSMVFERGEGWPSRMTAGDAGAVLLHLPFDEASQAE